MEIIVDIGNSRTKVAAMNHGMMTPVRSLPNGIDDDTQISIELVHAKRGIISTVAGGEERWIKAFPQIDWLILQKDTPVPFTNAYDTPNTLGLDRIALIAGAMVSFPNKNVLVIDAGTCVTYDMLTSKHNYVGGAISPGLVMRLKAMNQFTANLPLVQVDAQVKPIGTSTTTCLQAGALHGLAAEIDGTIKQYKSRYKHVQVVLTGGDANTLAPLIKNDIFARQNFLLEGLHAVLAYNSQ